jgi:two-component system NarL family response regulator
MPGVEGIELLRRLREASPTISIVVYTAELSFELAGAALAVGAAGVILKGSPLGDVLHALEAAARGAAHLDSGLMPAKAAMARGSLTDRETEVLGLVAEGLTYGEIGGRLGIGDETVRAHLKRASARLGALTRTHAVAKALRLGLIQ